MKRSLLVGLTTLFVISCFCVGTSVSTDDSTIAPTEIANTIQPTDEITSQSETETLIPTYTSQPTARATFTPDIIIDVKVIIGLSVTEIENIFGTGTEIDPINSSNCCGLVEFPDGGESRTYYIGKYSFYVFYDSSWIARGMQIVEGLAEDGYTLDQNQLILSRIGLNVTSPPDIDAPAAKHWLNYNGYTISIAASSAGGNVWTVQIVKLDN